jgi:hypothetical protein
MREMHDAIAFDLKGLQEAGQPMGEPSGLTAAYVNVAASPESHRSHASMPQWMWSQGSPRATTRGSAGSGSQQ